MQVSQIRLIRVSRWQREAQEQFALPRIPGGRGNANLCAQIPRLPMREHEQWRIIKSKIALRKRLSVVKLERRRSLSRRPAAPHPHPPLTPDKFSRLATVHSAVKQKEITTEINRKREKSLRFVPRIELGN